MGNWASWVTAEELKLSGSFPQFRLSVLGFRV